MNTTDNQKPLDKDKREAVLRCTALLDQSPTFLKILDVAFEFESKLWAQNVTCGHSEYLGNSVDAELIDGKIHLTANSDHTPIEICLTMEMLDALNQYVAKIRGVAMQHLV